ncbi:MAG: hypothetical protein LBH06_01525 [Rikenellaceae bacterium]|nr:hypothetical protein [Rikenellaceae bacterium]
MKRYGATTLVDDFEYSYNGNQLASLNGAHSFAYDSNGNMTLDGQKALRFGYNYLNLLSRVTDAADTAEVKASYKWLADGVKAGVVGQVGNNNIQTGDNSPVNAHNLESLVDIINSKDYAIAQLRKKIEQQHENFVERLNVKEKYYVDLLAEKERIITEKDKRIEHLAEVFDKRMLQKDDLFEKVNDEHREALSIVKNSIATLASDLAEKDNIKAGLLKQLEAGNTKIHELYDKLLETVKNQVK